MSETSMVERGRDAILAKVPAGYGMTPDEAAGYARAVIAAMRELPWLVLNQGAIAALECKLEQDEQGHGNYADIVARAYAAIIDAALSPEAKTGEGRE